MAVSGKTRRFWLAAAGAGVLAAGGGYWVSRLLNRGAASEAVNAAAVRALLDKPLPDLKGENRTLDSWGGRVRVVNFWATWCAPCRKEIPEFVRVQARYASKGLQVVGVAFDHPEPVAEFVREFGMNYPVLIGGMDTMALMRETGNRMGVLPFTLIVDRQGNAVRSHTGTMSEAQLESVILGLL